MRRVARPPRRVERPLQLLGLLGLLGLLVPAAPAAAQDYGTAARVNGVAISSERLTRYFQEFLGDKGRSTVAIRSPSAFKELKREALDRLIEQELLWQEARRRKRVATDAEVKAAVRRFEAQFPDERRRRLALERGGFTDESYRGWVRQQLSIAWLVERDIAPTIRVGAAEVRADYQATLHRYTRPAEARARQVLARLPAGAGDEARAVARARLEAVLAQARAGADFAALARSHSDDPSAASGGDLGWFGRGQLPVSLDEAAFSLAPGQVSDVLESPEGLHLLRLEERRAETVTPLEEARPGIEERLLQERRREAVEARAAALRKAGTVEVLIPL